MSDRDGEYGWNDAHAKMAARIAELEGELEAAKKGRQFVLETMQEENDGLRKFNDEARARVAELEAAHKDYAKLLVMSADRIRAAVLAEREACAEIADKYAVGGIQKKTAAIIATTIRARPAP